MIFALLLISTAVTHAQEEIKKYYSFDANYFYGTILEHNPDIAHLITDHPTGIILNFNRKTYGLEDWETQV